MQQIPSSLASGKSGMQHCPLMNVKYLAAAGRTPQRARHDLPRARLTGKIVLTVKAEMGGRAAVGEQYPNAVLDMGFLTDGATHPVCGVWVILVGPSPAQATKEKLSEGNGGPGWNLESAVEPWRTQHRPATAVVAVVWWGGSRARLPSCEVQAPVPPSWGTVFRQSPSSIPIAKALKTAFPSEPNAPTPVTSDPCILARRGLARSELVVPERNDIHTSVVALALSLFTSSGIDFRRGDHRRDSHFAQASAPARGNAQGPPSVGGRDQRAG